MNVELQLGKRHVAAVSVVLLLASASATVDVRDTLQVHGLVDMNNNKITGLEDPQKPEDAATKQYVNNVGSYGDGSDGEKVVAGTEELSGTKYYNGLLVKQDAEIDVGGKLVVLSNDTITVKGRIDANGAGGDGGLLDAYYDSSDDFTSTVRGNEQGLVSSSGRGDADAGWDGETTQNTDNRTGRQPAWSEERIDRLRHFGSSEYDNVIHNDVVGGSGGGSGGGLGGPSFAQDDDGGEGGDGGGIIILAAPEVRVSGELVADGEDGEDGRQENTKIDTSDSNAGGGGGGGGGGLISLVGGEVDVSNADLSVEGGEGGVTPGTTRSAGDGSDGEIFILD